MQTVSRGPQGRTLPPPTRRPQANATQEVQAADVLEVIDVLDRQRALPRYEDPIDEVSVEIVPDESPRHRASSASSIAPVDMSLAPPLDDEMTGSIDVVAVARRKRFGLIVGAAVGASMMLLVIGIGCKLASASSDGDKKGAESALAATPAVQTPPQSAPQKPALAAYGTPKDPPNAVFAGTPSTASTIGTIVIDSKAKKVWLDGKKMSATSAMVPCGAHKVKVGRGSAQSVDVPCGGEAHVTR